MGSDDTLREIVHSESKVKRVMDGVRYLVKSQQPAGPTNIPEEDPETRTTNYVLSHQTGGSTASFFSSASSRMSWSEEETKLIETALAHLDKVPTNNEIRSLFSSSIRLEAILKANSFERIRNKVHNLFNKRR